MSMRELANDALVTFQACAIGAAGREHPFSKPFFNSAIACTANLILFAAVTAGRGVAKLWAATTTPSRHASSGSPSSELSSFLDHSEEDKATSDAFVPLRWSHVRLLVLPAAMYTLYVVLAGVGVMLLPASVAFMVQGSCIVFTALCSRVLLKRPMNRLHVRGIALSMLGITIVAVAGYIYSREESHVPIPGPGPARRHGSAGSDVAGSVAWLEGADAGRHRDAFYSEHSAGPLLEAETLASASTSRDHAAGAWWEGHSRHHTHMPASQKIVMGVLFTLASQLAQALQFVSEEQLLCDSQLHPVQVMGLEGLLSTVFATVATLVATVIPGMDAFNRLESLSDTLAQLRNSPQLVAICVAFVASVAGGNLFGLRVSVRLGSVFRTVLLSLRTLLIWAADLAVFYAGVGGGRLGERWDGVASPLELCGFAALLLGTLLYAQGCSAVARDAGTIVREIEGMYRALSEGSLESVYTSGRPLWTPHGQPLPPTPPPPWSDASPVASPVAAADTMYSSEHSLPPIQPRPLARVSPSGGPFSWLGPEAADVSGGEGGRTSLTLEEAFREVLARERDSVAESAPGGSPHAGLFADVITGQSGMQPRAAEQLLERAVKAFCEHHGLSDHQRRDVRRELALRIQQGAREPTMRGTFTAATSWLVPSGYEDAAQHRGAGSYQNPFMPQMPRTGSELRLDQIVGRRAELADPNSAGRVSQNSVFDRSPVLGRFLSQGGASGPFGSGEAEVPEVGPGPGQQLTFDMLFEPDASAGGGEAQGRPAEVAARVDSSHGVDTGGAA